MGFSRACNSGNHGARAKIKIAKQSRSSVFSLCKISAKSGKASLRKKFAKFVKKAVRRLAFWILNIMSNGFLNAYNSDSNVTRRKRKIQLESRSFVVSFSEISVKSIEPSFRKKIANLTIFIC